MQDVKKVAEKGMKEEFTINGQNVTFDVHLVQEHCPDLSVEGQVYPSSDTCAYSEGAGDHV